MDLSSRLALLAGTSRLLVVSDFDGTLAEFSTDASNVPINAEAVSALQRLAALPETTVAILSGRHLDGLKQVSGFGPEFVLAGSHGLECAEYQFEMTAEQASVLDQVSNFFEELAAGISGAFVEYKPYHRVLHMIRATDAHAVQIAYDKALALDIPGAFLKPGKWIVEATAVNVTKGTWINQARETFNPTGVVFLGDDRTDEDGFAVLRSDDLSVKVGEGETQAVARVANVSAAGELLTTLADLRTNNGATRVEANI